MKDKAISLIRIVSMMFIIVCHLSTYFGSAAAAVNNLFNVGVYIFLFLSGFLYGKRTISRWSDWYRKRWVTLMLPLYIWFVLVTLAACVFQKSAPDAFSWVLILSNLQGLIFLVGACEWGILTKGFGHLWFLTALMICYAALPLLQKWRPKVSELSSGRITLLLFSVLAAKIACDYWLEIHITYLLTFCIGYFWSRSYKIPSCKGAFIWCIVAAMSCAIRIGGKMLWDDTFLYSQVIVEFSHTVLAVAIFNVLYFVHHKLTTSTQHIDTRWGGAQYIDKISYYIYITHYIFLETGAYDVHQYAPNNITAQLSLFFALAISSAVLLERICHYPIRWLLDKKP